MWEGRSHGCCDARGHFRIPGQDDPCAVMTANSRPRIVVGVSGSRASVDALRWAAAEARLRRATLHVVHAREAAHPGAPYASPASRLPAIDDPGSACSLLEDALTTVSGPGLPSQVTGELAAGRPEAVLVRCSAGADLLVLGSTSAVHEVGAPFGRSCGAACAGRAARW